MTTEAALITIVMTKIMISSLKVKTTYGDSTSGSDEEETLIEELYTSTHAFLPNCNETDTRTTVTDNQTGELSSNNEEFMEEDMNHPQVSTHTKQLLQEFQQ
ncbi:hypothetical protein RRG08_062449 [Elysia crispata]|uniref:Uncharacterized protein n=1 Tax=Elysia crispata TaxID=231223 RepID=A0AAE1CJD9_9GAST|nr:hypothetical protein RRG08_062449 [Elysia crispata]